MGHTPGRIMDKVPESTCVPTYRVLTDEQIKTLHRSTLEVLDTVGVKVCHAGALALLADAGCALGPEQRVLIPGALVEQCIASAPASITIYNRRAEETMRLEGRNVYYGLGTDLLETYDLKTGLLRPSELRDVVNAAVIGDYCPNIDFIASQAHPQDVAANLAYVASFKALVEHSIKPIYNTAAGRQDLEVIIQMAAAVAGGENRLRQRPFLIHYAEPISPLVHSDGAVDKLLLCAEKGIPLNYVPALLSGASGPVTLAGACVVANAEALSGLVIHQLRAPGAPMISGFSATPMDMVTGTTVYGSPDERLTHSACVDLYHYYGLPVWGEAGCSDAKCLDEQAAIESTASILMAALDGCNLVHDVGYLGQGLIGSPAAIVMCDEIISYVKRILRGFDIRPEQLGIDVIRDIGPGGSFLLHDQTVDHCREEHWRPRFMDRNNPEAWARTGGRRYAETVTQKALEILETHQPQTLAKSVSEALEIIYDQAREALTDRYLSA